MLYGFFVLMPSDLFAISSLLFTDEEVSFIEENFSQLKTDPLEVPYEKLSLTAIVYFDDGHWSLWVNDKMIGPETQDHLDPFYVEKVTPDEVTFSWKASPSKIFSLRPPQTIMFEK